MPISRTTSQIKSHLTSIYPRVVLRNPHVRTLGQCTPTSIYQNVQHFQKVCWRTPN
ncbi:hypothetical protein HanXRQr2_Chr11g0516021 [Helianthus annuus]|uniref:Uncharacterized protein n=1 Tax=Helianthus annuus TaxID=4232 RepID=A0A9K3HTC0_HELAN|nr:hypothetical protein HanXRQr2_Chr11g0516021 [Helianthus annuus]KAJ0877197.1 hypothetical protein HanPSC8_Chr11g0497311 [Helianthus annuus]